MKLSKRATIEQDTTSQTPGAREAEINYWPDRRVWFWENMRSRPFYLLVPDCSATDRRSLGPLPIPKVVPRMRLTFGRGRENMTVALSAPMYGAPLVTEICQPRNLRISASFDRTSA